MPDHIDHETIQNSDYLHRVLSKGSFLQQCIKKDVRVVFSLPQISGLIDELFWSVRRLPQTETSRYNKRMVFQYVRDMNKRMNMDHDIINERFFYPRYCPGIQFNGEMISKSFLFILISSSAILEDESDNNALLMIMFIGQVLVEVGSLCTMGFKYFTEGWNIIDICSYTLLLVWATFRDSDDDLAHSCLSFAAIPMTMSLLQVFVVIQSIGKLTLMVQAMSTDVLPLLLFTLFIMIGNTITFFSLFSGEEEYGTFGDSMISFFSGLLGNIELSLTKGGSILNTVGILALMLYAVITSIVLLNLLIAQMSNTYQSIEETSLERWLSAKASTILKFLVIGESNALCMLPSPFNLITTLLAPMDWFFFHKRRVSMCGTVADCILEFISLPIGYGAYFFESIKRKIVGFRIIFFRSKDKTEMLKDFGKCSGDLIRTVALSFIGYVVILIAHFSCLAYFQPVVELLPDKFKSIKFKGLEDEQNLRFYLKYEYEENFNALHPRRSIGIAVAKGDIIAAKTAKNTGDSKYTEFVDKDDIERIMKEIKDMTLDRKRKTLEGRLQCEIIDLREKVESLESLLKNNTKKKSW